MKDRQRKGDGRKTPCMERKYVSSQTATAKEGKLCSLIKMKGLNLNVEGNVSDRFISQPLVMSYSNKDD
jgi:hypothetical protein